ncbi:MliC family protein [Phenylobacterium sp.]|uniref:MliC family protein n=1 Tax=Phenylobacterium sp. TaxID=1871053 RepID=UPI0025FC0F56|nr:MliC family protein [Phenylobacterium sp.]
MRSILWLVAPLALTACSRPPAAGPAEGAVAWTPYVCADGRTLKALYPDATTAQVKLDGSTYRMSAGVSGSGVRYVGDGLQWWTKGQEGMLAAVKAGEDIATDPGVRCVQPAQKALLDAPVEPPAPGTPGGLPDDRTPLNERPAEAGSGQAAATVVETYYALVEAGKTADGAALRVDGVQEDLRPFRTLHAQVGAPGAIEGAAGSLYVDVPVVLYGRYAAGGEYHRSGKATLRRVDGVPGASAAQLRWRIETIAVK